MKRLKFLSMLLMVMTAFAFTACSSDDDEEDNSIAGWYMTEAGEGWEGYMFCSCLHFINKNTVDVYDYVANGKYWGKDESSFFGGRSGWYYQTDCQRTYTYVITDGKIYLTNGTILTIIDKNTLRPDGFSYNYTREK